MNAPLYLARSGSISDGSFRHAGGDGYYWSSTVRSPEHTCYLGFNSGDVYQEYGSQYVGFSLRCVLREAKDKFA